MTYSLEDGAVQPELPLNDLCVVCDKPITDDQSYVKHYRLNVKVHFNCPKTNVCGEDISMHTMQFVVRGDFQNEIDSWK